MEKFNANELPRLSILAKHLKKGENIVHKVMAELMPMSLRHVWTYENPTQLNYVLSCFKTTNRNTAVRFFEEFQPHEYTTDNNDKRKKVFGKRVSREHTRATKQAMERFFSVDPQTGTTNPSEGYYGGNFWLWEETTIKVEGKKPDYKANFTKALTALCDGKKGGYTQKDVVNLLLEEGFDVEVMLAILSGDIEEAE